jgi:hypothetical protein
MVCDDCKTKLSVLSAPDPWKSSSSGGSSRLIDENKALRKGARANPYGNCCKICKMKVQQNNATYCTMCAYAKGICAICGKQVLDTSMYKMSEGGGFSKMSNRDEAAFKSAEQLSREAAQQTLLEYLQETGSVGRMPTRAALESTGKRELADALIAAFGGLHAAADAMGLSKRLLNEEGEARKQAKREAAQQQAEAAQQQQQEQQQALQQEQPGQEESAKGGGTGGGDADDMPPGVARPTAPSQQQQQHQPTPAPAAASASVVVPPPPPPQRSTDSRWQYDPNTGLYFQRSTQKYYDHDKRLYFVGGRWVR